MAESIKQKAAKGMFWALFQRFSGMGIQFLSGVVLARLLLPEDYGAIGMLLIFMVVAEAFIDGGFGAALIQKKNPTQEDYSTIFWWNVTVAFLLCGIMYIISPFVASFYDMPMLCKVLRIQSLVLIVRAFSSVQGFQLQKQFQFKKITIANLIASVVSLPITICMAYLGYGVWSLVTQNFTTAGITTIIYWSTNKWYPNFVFSKSSFKSLFSFGFYMFLSHLLNEICNNIQGLLIGRFYSASVMGYFTKAKSTEKLASVSITQALQQVTFPLYSALQDDKKELISVIKQLTQLVAFVVFPLMFSLILIARPLFIILYSERWMQSIPYFQVLCLLGLSACLQAINTQTIAAIGKSKEMFVWTIVKRINSLFFIVGGIWAYGIWGLVFGCVLQNWMIYFINVALVAKYVGYRFHRQLMNLFPTLLLCIVCFIMAYFVGKISNLGMYAKGSVEFVLFWGFYLILARFFRFHAFFVYKTKISLLLEKVYKIKR